MYLKLKNESLNMYSAHLKKNFGVEDELTNQQRTNAYDLCQNCITNN